LLLPCIIILFLHLLSTNHKCTQPCYFHLLLKRREWTEILRWRVLGYVLPRLLFLWCYGIFRCSVPLRVIIVFRDTIYVIIIFYWWHLVIREHFWQYVWNNWSWVMHTMSTWFWHKNRVWQGRSGEFPASRRPYRCKPHRERPIRVSFSALSVRPPLSPSPELFSVIHRLMSGRD
jgi:hypothetical protein